MSEPIAAAAASAGIKVFGELLLRLGPAVANTVTKSLRTIFERFDAAFGPHLQATFDRCTKIKTLLNKDEPVDLLSQYVNIKFRCGGKTYDDYAVIEEIRKRKKIIISGTAGGGKQCS